MFCGACGALLDRPLPSRGGSGGRDRSSWWRHPAVAGGLAVLVLVGVVTAVPTLSIERTDPIEDTTIDVPDTDELQGAPAGTRTRRQVDPPQVTCTRDDVEVDCVRWSRGLLDPMDNGRGPQTWPMVFGDHLLLVGDGEVEAVDAATGTRLWRTDAPHDAYPAGALDGVLVLQRPSGMSGMDLATGDPRWSVDTSPPVHGHVVHDDIVLTGPDPDAATALVARDPRDGEVLWTWSSPAPWHDLHVRRLDRERLLVSSTGQGVAVVDASTGGERSLAEDLTEAWIVGVVDGTILTLAQPDMDLSEPNPAGDPGAVVSGIDLVDGTTRWTRDVRSSQSWFSVVGDLVIAPSSRHLTALDTTTGETVWEVQTARSEALAQYQPVGPWQPLEPAAAEAPTIVVTLAQTTGVARGREAATGKLVWEQDLSQDAWHAVVTADHVVVQTNGGVRVLSVATGEERLGVDSPQLQLAGTDPFIVFHQISGYVARLDLSAAEGR